MSPGWLRILTLAVVMGVACLDTVTGLHLMFGSQPWLQNGQETLWLQIPAEIRSNPQALTLLHALYGRLGAFSFHVGVVTLIWAWWSRNSALRLQALLVVYALTGGAFFWFDNEYLYGTGYFWLKVGISIAWTTVLVLNLAFDRAIFGTADVAARASPKDASH